jgi:hypothetical protein
MPPCFRPYFILAVLWALYFHPLVLHPARTLHADYSDFLAEHLPAKLFLNREWRSTGELPLWNPYHFAGSPFVHDIQVGCFYPPYAVAYLVPEESLGAALSWVTALHVLAAGVFAYLYARSYNLGEVGSLVAAAGFMLSAKWMTHLLLAGHTVTVGLAWLPLVLLGLERGIRTGRVWPVGGAGVALALLVLGTHPQWAFYAGVFAAAWTLGTALERAGLLASGGREPPVSSGPNRGLTPPARRELLRWLLCGLGVGAIAVPLCAVQLLPSWEASGLSARTGGVAASGALELALPTFLGLVGLSPTNDPPRAWEVRGLFGACWLAAALAAPALAGGRARWQLGVLLGLIFFSVGGAVLIEWLPGFNLFRVPGRMLLIAAFPLAFLAGVTTDALIRGGWDEADRRVLRRYLGLVALAAVLPAAASALVGYSANPDRTLWLPGVLGWTATLVALPIAVWLCRPGTVWRPQPWAAAWVVVLFAELLAPTVLLPEVRPQRDIYPESTAVRFLADHARPGESRVLDWDTGTGPDKVSALGTGSPLALVYGVESARGYNPLDVRHYREYLGFVVGDPSPVRGNSPLAQQVVPNFEIGNRPLLDLLNVRYAVYPADHPVDRATWRPIAEDPGPPAVPPLPPRSPARLPPHVVYENPDARPRAFVVPEAAAMPTGRELEALKACDFTRTVLLTAADPLPPAAAGPLAPARITEYRPNRVRVQLDGGGGFLVLTDVWFPGWVCRVDGVEVPVYRANHAFRAVALPAVAREAVFAFEPRSYRVGWWVSVVVVVLLAGFLIVGEVLKRVRG